MKGFADSQIASIVRYKRLLLELGEHSGGSMDGWPAWIKVGLLILFNTITFIVLNKFKGLIGGNTMDWVLNQGSKFFTGEFTTKINDDGTQEKIISSEPESTNPTISNILSMISGFTGGGGLANIFGGGNSTTNKDKPARRFPHNE